MVSNFLQMLAQAFSLAGVAQQQQRVATKIVATGGGDAIMAAMRTHKACQEFQRVACMALYDLALIEQNQFKISEEGAIEVICTAMRRHSKDQDLQRWACSALGLMCSLNAQNQERAASAGGPELIVAAMRNPKAPLELIQCACLTLLNLAADSTNQLKIAQAGLLNEKKISLLSKL